MQFRNRQGVIGAATILIAVAANGVAVAQDPAARAEASYRRAVVQMLENILFKVTDKTTTIIYAKRYDVPGGSNLFCGTARFGTTPQMFTLNSATSVVVRGPNKAQWTSAGCEEVGYETLIDLR